MQKTTIQVKQKTLERLKNFKKFERESYDEILNNIFNEIEKEELSTEEITEIQMGLEDVKHGRVSSIEKVAKEFGIILR